MTNDGSRTVEFDTSFLANLPDELKLSIEKADTVEELVNLAKENGVDLSDEQVDQLANGGWGSDNGKTCPDCGCRNIIQIGDLFIYRYKCMDCGKQWPSNQ
jgi:DNA-directed RNA polymerase subunit RPC12/RpoP